MYRVKDWDVRYEVDTKGHEWEPGRAKRKWPLLFVRLKVHGRSQGTGWRKLIREAGPEQALMVFGLYCKLLEIAADAPREQRGTIPPETGDDESISFLLSVPSGQVADALAVLEKLGWITKCPGTPGNSREVPANVTEPNRTKLNLTEPGTIDTVNSARAHAHARRGKSRRASSEKARADGDGPERPASGASAWAQLRQEIAQALGPDQGIAQALAQIAAASLFEPGRIDEVACQIRLLLRDALRHGDRPSAYFMGALKKRFACVRGSSK